MAEGRGKKQKSPTRLHERGRCANVCEIRLFALNRCLGSKHYLEDFENLDITQVRGLHFSFRIDFEAALAFRKARGEYLREYQYQPLEVEVYI